jgi:large subunit ribosomal protein L10
MNREQKAAAIAEIATQIDESHAIFAVDYRGISVPQVAELRSKLRDADATFKVVKNSLTERAADASGVDTLKAYLEGPTALTFVRGDAATAAKAIADYARATQLLPFKGGLMDGAVIDIDQIRALSRLPSREVLYGRLVGVVASPISGVVRTLSALLGGLASALRQVHEKKASGEIPAGEPPAAEATPDAEPAADAQPAAQEPTDGEEPSADAASADGDAEPAAETADGDTEAAGAEAGADDAAAASAEEASAADADADAGAPEESPPEAAEVQDAAAAEDAPATEAAAEPQDAAPAEAAPADAPAQDQAEPASPATDDDNEADASAQAEPDAAEANPTKED